MKEYLEVQSHISKKKKQGWKIAQLAKNIERAFRSGDKIVQLTYRDKESKEVIERLYYTPVTKRLKKCGEKLGNYLHSMQKFRAPDDPWWRKFRELLENTYKELKKATTGTLLGPPMMKNKREIDVRVEIDKDKEERLLLEWMGKRGKEVLLDVKCNRQNLI